MKKAYYKPTYCKCHPETCCCNPWSIYDENDELMCRVYDKEKAIKIVNSMNIKIKD
jgi:hypothetical protein